MIIAYDIENVLYHSSTISNVAASWCWLGAPLARSSVSSCLAVANELGTGVQRNSDRDGLDPAHGLVAVDAERVVRLLTLAAAVQVTSAT